MTKALSRRGFLAGAAGAGIAGSAATFAAPNLARGQSLIPLRTGTLAGGWSHLTNDIMIEKGFDQRNGVKMEIFGTYGVLTQYYNDFVAGNIQVDIGAWDAFAKFYQKGAPIQLVGLVTGGRLAGFFSRPEGPAKLEDLKGKTIAAMQSSGTYLMMRAWAKRFSNIVFEKDVEVQNAPNPPGTIALVSANRADAALSWEHSLSTGLHRVPGSKIFLNVGEYYERHVGHEMPYFCVAMRTDAIKASPPGTVAKVVKIFAEHLDWVHANEPDFAERARRIEIDPAVLKTALSSGRMKFKMRSTAEPKVREDILFAANILTEDGFYEKKLDDGFFAV
jgi:NitT/TauT family transport system substrate-binding protein